jgi:hypothetical protein
MMNLIYSPIKKNNWKNMTKKSHNLYLALQYDPELANYIMLVNSFSPGLNRHYKHQHESNEYNTSSIHVMYEVSMHKQPGATCHSSHSIAITLLQRPNQEQHNQMMTHMSPAPHLLLRPLQRQAPLPPQAAAQFPLKTGQVYPKIKLKKAPVVLATMCTIIPSQYGQERIARKSQS